MIKQKAVNKKGFTLIEILVVVLIIGVLVAIALPGYKKSVEKSKVADALTVMTAVVEGEHDWYLTHSRYTDDFSKLAIGLIDKNGNKAEDESFESENYTFTLLDDVVEAARNNGEYSIFKFYEKGDIFCFPNDHYICQTYNWKSYMDRNRCNTINGFWSDKTSTCYGTDKERCQGNGSTWQNGQNNITVLKDGFCGSYNVNGGSFRDTEYCVAYNQHDKCQNGTFTGSDSSCILMYNSARACNNSSFYEGAKCDAACQNAHFYSGSKCYGNTSGTCYGATFEGNSICYANYGGKGDVGCIYSQFDSSVCVENAQHGCRFGNFKNGSILYANFSHEAWWYVTFDDTSCCCGNYCGSYPKCSTRGIQCDPKYIK